MFTRQRSAWRQQFRRSRTTQVAVSVAIAVVAVVAALAGMSLADQHVESLNQAALGACLSSGTASAAANAAPGASPAASAPPCPAQSAGATPSASASPAGPRVDVAPNTFANGLTAQRQLGDVASQPVDGQGNAISLNQTTAQASASQNCTLVVPANPLTAQGLATPYQLGDGCSEANPNEQAFVEATILSPNGQVQVYNPLVITQGTTPAAQPVPPTIPRHSRVIIDFGSNGINLVLAGPGAVDPASGCVDALGQSLIGQVAACDAVPFYNLANSEIARRTLRIPWRGTAKDGLACETTRDFALIDQDQSDNVYSAYLLTGSGQTAQATPANQTALGDASLVSNGSDNALLGKFVDPVNGCAPLTKPDPTSLKVAQGSQALDELSAGANQRTQIAVVPTNDEMTLVGGAFSIAKTNMYRSLVDQPQLAANTDPYEVAAAYCMNMVNIAPRHNQLDMRWEASFATPVPAVGDSLATFLGNRLSMSFANLGCAGFGLTNPVNVTADASGVATAVGYNAGHQQATLPEAEATPGGGRGHHRAPSQGHGHRHRVQDPSGM